MKLTLTPDDTALGWTPGMLAAASSLYRRGTRTPIVRDGYRRYERARHNARNTARIWSTRRPVDLDDVLWLLTAGETIERAAERMGVTVDAVQAAARRKGTPEQRARIAAARSIESVA